ncbi:MAG: IS1595 family transposase [Rhodospirillaceae bacterium]|nr:MAG: IS1595 family transposase [Rhodospirillaceae bacterium]
MAQHFLLSKAARTLSLAQVARMSDEEARQTFQRIRWSSNDGEAFCPRCGCLAVYAYASRPIWKCKGCNHQFSVTSGTIFASHKLPIRDYLLAIAIFMNGAKGHSALQLSRDLNVQYKTAFVLAHKLREAMASEVQDEEISGEVEVDGAYFGGYVKPANYKENRRDRRLAKNQNGKRRVVVIMRERNGTTLPFVFKSEDASVETIMNRVERDTVIHADEASHWDAFHGRFETKRINHSQAYSDGSACTNMAESFFSRLRRAEIGTHHHISGKYLAAYANEMAWREDNRRVSNGEQFGVVVAAALAHPVSRQWKGYWQR